MQLLARAGLVIALLVGSLSTVSADDIAADIARIHIEAIGGMERVKRLHSFRAAGQSRVGDVALDFQMWAARPSFIRIEVQTGRQMLIQGWNGEEEPWIRGGPSGPVQPMPANVRERFKSESDFDSPLFQPMERGFSLEYAGEGEVNSRPVVKLLATRNLTDQSTLHLAADTYFIVRQDKFRINPDGSRVDTRTFYDDFRPILGVILPHRILVYENDQLMSDVVLNWMEPNPPVEEGWFDSPVAEPAVPGDLKAPAASSAESINELVE